MLDAFQYVLSSYLYLSHFFSNVVCGERLHHPKPLRDQVSRHDTDHGPNMEIPNPWVVLYTLCIWGGLNCLPADDLLQLIQPVFFQGIPNRAEEGKVVLKVMHHE